MSTNDDYILLETKIACTRKNVSFLLLLYVVLLNIHGTKLETSEKGFQIWLEFVFKNPVFSLVSRVN